MLLEQIDAAAMQRHSGRVRNLKSVLHVHLQNLMFRGWLAAICFQNDMHGRELLAIAVAHACAKLKHEGGAGSTQSVGGPFERIIRQGDLRPSFHEAFAPCRFCSGASRGRAHAVSP